jgi:hypothetical protein
LDFLTQVKVFLSKTGKVNSTLDDKISKESSNSYQLEILKKPKRLSSFARSPPSGAAPFFVRDTADFRKILLYAIFAVVSGKGWSGNNGNGLSVKPANVDSAIGQ